MALTTSGLKKRVKKRLPVGGAGGKKKMPAPIRTRPKGKPTGERVGGIAGKAGPKVTRPVVGGATGTVREGSKRKPVTNVRPVVGGAPKPGAGNKISIAAKKKDHAYNVAQRKKTVSRLAAAREKTKAHLGSLRKKGASRKTLALAKKKAQGRYAKIKGQSTRRRTIVN